MDVNILLMSKRPSKRSGAPRPDELELPRQVARKLSPEFEGIFSPETIERFALDAWQHYSPLRQDPRTADYLPSLTERFLRVRLQFARGERLDLKETAEVLFVCVRNAGRSQMAAAVLEHLGDGKARARSTGTSPAEDIQPEVVTALRDMGIDVSGQVPKALTDEAVRSADVIVTLGCGDACPIYPGKRYLDWPLPDPHAKGLSEVKDILDDIAHRVSDLLAGLPDLPTGLATSPPT